MSSVSFTSGSGSWTVPAGVTSLQIEVWGGGGGGGKSTPSGGGVGGGGGGGGGYSLKSGISVTGGTTVVNYSVGNGGATQFAGVATQAQIMSIFLFMTGNGGSQGASPGTGGNGGTASGGTTNTTGSTASSNSGQNGGAGGASPNGGSGGAGGSPGSVGSVGNSPGGGGGGGGANVSTAQDGGAGSNGMVTFTYIVPGGITNTNLPTPNISDRPFTQQWVPGVNLFNLQSLGLKFALPMWERTGIKIQDVVTGKRGTMTTDTANGIGPSQMANFKAGAGTIQDTYFPTSYYNGGFCNFGNMTFDLTKGFTVAFWQRQLQFNGNVAYLFNCNGFCVYWVDPSQSTSSATLRIEYTDSDGGASQYNLSVTATLNAWMHVAISFSVQNNQTLCNLYINGVLNQTSFLPYTPVLHQGNFILGAQDTTPATPNYLTSFFGFLKDFRIYAQPLLAGHVARIKSNPEDLYSAPQPVTRSWAYGATFSETMSGGVYAAGQAIANLYQGLWGNGTAKINLTFTNNTAQGLLANGSALVKKTNNIIAQTNGVLAGGSAIYARTTTMTTNGNGVLAAGSAKVTSRVTNTTTGKGVLCNGSAKVSKVYNIVGSGGVLCNGTAKNWKLVNITTNGNGLLGNGVATIKARYLPTTTGKGVLCSGSATLGRTSNKIASGGVYANGSAKITARYLPTTTGNGLLAAGSAKSLKTSTIPITSAGLLAAGSGKIQLTAKPSILASGVKVSGNSVYRVIHSNVASGGVLVGGAARFGLVTTKATTGNGVLGNGTPKLSVLRNMVIAANGVLSNGSHSVNKVSQMVVVPKGVKAGGSAIIIQNYTFNIIAQTKGLLGGGSAIKTTRYRPTPTGGVFANGLAINKKNFVFNNVASSGVLAGGSAPNVHNHYYTNIITPNGVMCNGSADVRVLSASLLLSGSAYVGVTPAYAISRNPSNSGSGAGMLVTFNRGIQDPRPSIELTRIGGPRPQYIANNSDYCLNHFTIVIQAYDFQTVNDTAELLRKNLGNSVKNWFDSYETVENNRIVYESTLEVSIL